MLLITCLLQSSLVLYGTFITECDSYSLLSNRTGTHAHAYTPDSRISAPRLAIRGRIVVPHACVQMAPFKVITTAFQPVPYTLLLGLPRTKQCGLTSQGDFGTCQKGILTNAECRRTSYSFSHIRLAPNMINYSYERKTCANSQDDIFLSPTST
jgi:hypothetical protein